MSTENLYRLLGIKTSATADEIKKAYRKLAKKYHPDVNPDNKEAEKLFMEITKAYDVLSNEASKKEYDKQLHIKKDKEPIVNKQPIRPQSNQFNPMDTSHMFDKFFTPKKRG